MALYAYEALLAQDAETASAIATVVLSGLALEPFADILERQLALVPAGAQLKQALASCDWPVLRERLGISCAYVEDARSRPSGRAMFERLATRAPRARWHVFQGTHDWNTPVEPERALQAWDASAGHLGIEFHYYDGTHQGSDAARAEVARLLTAIAAE